MATLIRTAQRTVLRSSFSSSSFLFQTTRPYSSDAITKSPFESNILRILRTEINYQFDYAPPHQVRASCIVSFFFFFQILIFGLLNLWIKAKPISCFCRLWRNSIRFRCKIDRGSSWSRWVANLETLRMSKSKLLCLMGVLLFLNLEMRALVKILRFILAWLLISPRVMVWMNWSLCALLGQTFWRFRRFICLGVMHCWLCLIWDLIIGSNSIPLLCVCVCFSLSIVCLVVEKHWPWLLWYLDFMDWIG